MYFTLRVPNWCQETTSAVLFVGDEAGGPCTTATQACAADWIARRHNWGFFFQRFLSQSSGVKGRMAKNLMCVFFFSWPYEYSGARRQIHAKNKRQKTPLDHATSASLLPPLVHMHATFPNAFNGRPIDAHVEGAALWDNFILASLD